MKKTGEKFTAKYGVETANLYKDPGTLDNVRIPGADHFLYDPTAPVDFDEIRVEAIDRDGKMTTPIEVWTDPDQGVLWVLDGRGRYLDVREVNRRRKAEGRELVKAYLVPFPGDEKAAVARLREKNYHRRSPTPSGMALDLVALRARGHAWPDCAKILHHQTEDAEKWGRRLLPLAYCIEEVRAAIDAGELPRSAAARFGGSAADGTKALGKREQAQLLAQLRQEKKQPAARPPTVSPKARSQVRAHLGNGASEGLRAADREVAKVVAATLALVDGDAQALAAWPEVAAAVKAALAPAAKR